MTFVLTKWAFGQRCFRLLGFYQFSYKNFKITFIFCWSVLQWIGYLPSMLSNHLLVLRSIQQLPILTELKMATDEFRDACMYRTFAFVFQSSSLPSFLWKEPRQPIKVSVGSHLLCFHDFKWLTKAVFPFIFLFLFWLFVHFRSFRI